MSARPLGAVLAGGRGSRLGGAKAVRRCAGRPLIDWPVAAVRAALGEVVVVAKRTTELPPLDVPVWHEPDEPTHPLTGIVHALRCAEGRPVVVAGCDLPLVQPAHVRVLLEMHARWGGTVVGVTGDRLQPLFGLYAPEALEVLVSAPPDAPLTMTVAALSPGRAAFGDDALLNVNTSTGLRKAERALRRR